MTLEEWDKILIECGFEGQRLRKELKELSSTKLADKSPRSASYIRKLWKNAGVTNESG